MKIVEVKTTVRNQMIDITNKVQDCVAKSKAKNGVVYVFVPHTTAGITICENADKDVKTDVMFALKRAVPNSGFLHYEGNSDAHTKAQLTGFSITIIIDNSKMMLGTWQSIYFCEFDGPRTRSVYIKVINIED